MSNITTLLAVADSAGFSPHGDFLRKLFKELRKSKVRRPDIVCKYAAQVLRSCSDDVDGWAMHEFIFLCALDLGEEQLADRCLQPVLKRFPGSTRGQLLLGQWQEYKGEHETALILYDQLLKENPANLPAMKRKVCVFRAQNKLKEAMDELTAVVNIFYSDTQAWLELADIYTSVADYKSAAVCLEEVVIIQSNSSLAHVRLAEVYYTLGSREYLELARHHYSISLNLLSPENNLRALYGLISACSCLIDLATTKSDEIEVSTKLRNWASRKLLEISAFGAVSFVACCISTAIPQDD